MLKSNHPGLLSEYLEGSSPPDTVAIPTLLLKLTRLDALSPQSSLFSANMLECLLIMVSRGTDDMVASPSWSLITELVQVKGERVRGSVGREWGIGGESRGESGERRGNGWGERGKGG